LNKTKENIEQKKVKVTEEMNVVLTSTKEENVLKEQFEIIKESIEHLNKEEELKKMRKEQEIQFLKDKRKKIENQKALLLDAMKKKQDLEQKANEILIQEVLKKK